MGPPSLLERRLDGDDLVALLLDGKTFAEDEMVTAVGVTITGEKVLLGFVQTATENRKVYAAFLRELVERELPIEAGLLVVIDGAKGLHAAVREVCGSLQRCSNAANGTSARTCCSICPIGTGRRFGASCRRRTSSRPLRVPNAHWANCAANSRLNASAAASLDEGLDETLTLHRLGVFADLGTSLKTTNALESIHARVESWTAKVDHWKNSEQKQRWLATALLDLEPRLRRIRNYRALPLLQKAIKQQLQGVKQSAA